MNILIKYPGSKKSLIKDINEVFNKSQCDRIIDVFGGSGVVLLNINAEYKVYNDINLDLVNLFNTIKYNYNEFYRMVISLKNREVFNYYKYNINSMNGNSTEKAFKTFFLLNTTFGGQGNTYIKYDRSKFNFVLRIINNLNNLKDIISPWIIENMDYKEIIKKYDNDNTFFYIDPPYIGKKWYDFNLDSYRNLNNLVSKINGSYLMNFEKSNDAINIFGNPDFVRRYKNTGKSYRYYYFYTNVR